MESIASRKFHKIDDSGRPERRRKSGRGIKHQWTCGECYFLLA